MNVYAHVVSRKTFQGVSVLYLSRRIMILWRNTSVTNFQRDTNKKKNKEYICKQCHNDLRHPDEIWKSITKDTQDIEHDDLKCFFCEETPKNIFYQYDANLYKDSALYDQLQHNEMSISKESIICEKCHKYLKSKCEVKCVLCERMRAKKDTYLFNRKRYKSIPSDNEKMEWNFDWQE